MKRTAPSRRDRDPFRRPASSGFALAPMVMVVIVATVASGQSEGDRAAEAHGAQEEPPADAGSTVPVLRFRSAFWINLHHELYRAALAESDVAPGDTGDADWRAAVSHYRSDVVARDLLFDAELRRVDAVLGAVPDDARELPEDVPSALRDALHAAAPHYAAALWPAHDAANRAFVEALTPLVDAHLASVAGRVSELFQHRWRSSPVVVDVLAYANWAGAYTSDGPDHVRFGVPAEFGTDAFDPTESFETLVHEASHLIVDRVHLGITASAEAQGVEVSPTLWHALLFDTVGRVVAASPAAPDGYVPYAEAHGLYARAWRKEKAAIDRFWPAYVSGEVELAFALDEIVAALGEGN